MSTGSTRPGGLTALAIFNFILCAFGVLGIMGNMAAIGMMMSGAVKSNPGMPDVNIIIVLTILNGLSTILLVVSGIGYMKLKVVLGRYVGSAYGILGVTTGILAAVLMKQEFGMLNFAMLIYPLLTVIVLNTVFRKDFIN